MKTFFLTFLPTVFLCVVFAGCSESGPTTSTAGADADAIAEYEAAIGAIEKQDVESGMGTETE